MNIIVPIGSILCFAVGLWFCWPPIEKYRASIKTGAFGVFLVIVGVVLMTTFKWSDAIVRVIGIDMELRQAQAHVSELQISLDDARRTIETVRAASNPTEQNVFLKTVASSVSALPEFKSDSNPVEPQTIEDAVKTAVQKSGYFVVPYTTLNKPSSFEVDKAPPVKG
ncbi:hypothetical protein LJR251_000306 [Rhizobium rhizogenes]|uniref:hypothetical protein n=1 Tax=Rhizobium rhizogenes TaxID=359 RepID=UPI003ECE40A5